ncbi:hypothetical protein T439DRAFT_357510 [Meredithblackwellia eburnea MCA 4105]
MDIWKVLAGSHSISHIQLRHDLNLHLATLSKSTNVRAFPMFVHPSVAGWLIGVPSSPDNFKYYYNPNFFQGTGGFPPHFEHSTTLHTNQEPDSDDDVQLLDSAPVGTQFKSSRRPSHIDPLRPANKDAKIAKSKAKPPVNVQDASGNVGSGRLAPAKRAGISPSDLENPKWMPTKTQIFA